MLNLAEKEKDSDFFLFLANMHAFTQLHDPVALRQNSINIFKLYLACGIDPKRFLIYNPAEIPGHVQLGRVLTCLTNMGYMERMHAYKDALAK
jgi:tryptophanyl-tRNA synthetase